MSLAFSFSGTDAVDEVWLYTMRRGGGVPLCQGSLSTLDENVLIDGCYTWLPPEMV